MLGQAFDQYRLVEQIGVGGMGIVYRARDERLDRDVAVKLLSAGVGATETARRRFRKEALALSQLSHPNIATIHDFRTYDGLELLIMEYIPGETLAEKLRVGPLPMQQFGRLALQLVRGLAAAHEQGILHRDLKPRNIRITPDDRLKILDFGLAQLMPGKADQFSTATNLDHEALAGTLPYMPPEQLRGQMPGERTDIYAVGAALYEMATGRRLFPAAEGLTLITAILHDAPAPPTSVNRELPPVWDHVILKALNKDPTRRYQSMRELVIDVEQLVEPTASVAYRPPRSPRWRRVAVAALSLVVAAIAGWLWFGHGTTPAARAFRERDWVLVADFDNFTGDTELDQTVSAALTMAIQQSRYLNVLSREQVFDAVKRMQRPIATHIDEATALEICQRENVRVVLTGDIRPVAETTRILVRAFDCGSRLPMFLQSEDLSSKRELYARVDTLARRVRERLGESVSTISATARPLEKVSTLSLPALQRYSRAVDSMAQGRTGEATPLLKSALELDPEFAMAHRLLARVYGMLGDRSRQLEHLAQAYRVRANVTDRERCLIEASHYNGEGDYERVVEALSLLVSLYPDDIEAGYELATAHRDAGNAKRAIEQFRDVLRRPNPYSASAYAHLVLLLARQGQGAEALRVAEEARRVQIRAPRLEWARAMALFGEGRIDEGEAALNELRQGDDVHATIARIYLASVTIYRGRLAEGAQQLSADIRVDVAAGTELAELMRRYLLARIALVQVRPHAARRQVGLMMRASGQPRDLRRAATLYAWLGDLQQARGVLARLAAERERVPSAFNRSSYAMVEGEIALASGRSREALESFQAADALYPQLAAQSGLARAYGARRDWARAAEHWRRIVALRAESFHDGFPADWVLAHLELARIHRRLGELRQARESYQRVLQIWEGADDVPIYRAAVAEWSTLENFSQGHFGQYSNSAVVTRRPSTVTSYW